MKLTELTLADLNDIIAGYQSISFDEFRSVLSHTIGADEDYAGHVWTSFTNNPFYYCASRNPRSQGEVLTILALQKAQAIRDAR